MNYQFPSSITYATPSYQPTRMAQKPSSNAATGIAFPVTRAHYAKGVCQSSPLPTGGSSANPPTGLGKPDKRAIELKYSDHIATGGKYGNRDGVLHRWNGAHWVAIAYEPGVGDAIKWLRANHPSRANKATAKSCFTSAPSFADDLPEQSLTRCIIPLQNVYLEVTENGTILTHNPNPSFGITYALKTGLPQTGKTYTPAPVPAESLFGKFLATSIPDQEVQDYLQETMGYTLTPFTMHQIALLLKGGGRNGKSVMVRILSALHGRPAAINLKRLNSFGLAPLIGASLATCDEVPESGLDTDTLKALITGDPVQVDRKYLEAITYRSTAKWVICTNHDQRTNDNSDGFWRRMTVIPFSHQILSKDTVAGLDQKIINTELRVVLDWCLAGLQRLMKRGRLPAEPQALVTAKSQAVIASDHVAAWVQECEVVASTNASDLKSKDEVFKRYCQWCSTNKAKAMDAAAFWTRLRKLVPLEREVQLRIGGPRRRYVQIRFECDAPSEPVTEAATPFDDA